MRWDYARDKDPWLVLNHCLLPPPDPRRILLVATMRNEGPFVLEWVAYHRAIGFTDFVVCTNDCVDGSPELLDRLAELGLIKHIRTAVAPGERAQLAAYAQAERLPVLGEAHWAMVLDADEFLNIHVGDGTVTALIDAAPSATAFLLNWRMFGHAGHEAFRPGFVTERFTRAARLADPVNLSFKTLFSKIDVYAAKLLPHGPGYADERRVHELAYVNGAGVAVSNDVATTRTFVQSAPGAVSFALAQINHYNTRAREDYLVKHHRGGGLDIVWDRETNWAIFNKNDEEDRSILERLPRAKAIVDALLDDGDVRRRHERCCALYREHIEALTRTADPEASR